MEDLKTDFQNQLIKQECKKRTNKDRPRTVYKYCKPIDRLCYQLYSDHSTDKWEALTINIGKILIPYYECSNKEYYIDQYNAKTDSSIIVKLKDLHNEDKITLS